MTVIPNYYAMTVHIEHQQAALLAAANRERRVIEAERGAPRRPSPARHLAVVTAVVLLALLFAVSVAPA
jgi:hypothetical protein